MSAADVSDMWIHEGWTTYLESLYVEHLFGNDDALKYVNGYKSKVRNREPIITQRGIHRHAAAGHVLQGRALPQHAAQRRRTTTRDGGSCCATSTSSSSTSNIMTEDVVAVLQRADSAGT